ncbi:hypothetical protein BDQ17DRAFT_1367385 [Cyathus striatus]|nr:hypothetical protein BDQ17DRAFT_1367385 [Cyathus striatus]
MTTKLPPTCSGLFLPWLVKALINIKCYLALVLTVIRYGEPFSPPIPYECTVRWLPGYLPANMLFCLFSFRHPVPASDFLSLSEHRISCSELIPRILAGYSNLMTPR